ncbi:hypothetical protein [Luteolibacter luteus]|uniref:Uncharacterized protein n=1 Tax=Luteolibacter luteus TaxID=2728835 RepID=A0A858RKT1_9BACT|nr:hypothetical protein [Luteolibacter luteus]QJE96633.1 hypothetical protein HHL09_12835 [Luteolibacter luteus]
MASTRENRHSAKTAAILIAGVLTGIGIRWLGGKADTGSALSSEHSQEQGSLVGTRSASALAPTKSKDRELPTGWLTFSPQQWSDLVRAPREWQLSLQNCKMGSVPVFDDIPIVGRLFQEGERGPSLERHAAFFGWEKELSKQVREALFLYSGEVEKLQRETAQVTYPGKGKVRIDYSAGKLRQQELSAGLGKQLEGLIGLRDKERFMLMTSIPSWSNETRELSVVRAEDGRFLMVKGLAGIGEFPVVDLADPAAQINGFLQLEQGEAVQGIDWQQLIEEARPGASTR